MSYTDRLLQILTKDGLPPLNVLDEFTSLLKDQIAEGGPLYPLEDGDNASMASSQCALVATDLEKRGSLAASETLLVQAWNEFGLRQRQARTRVYRADLAFKLTDLYLRWNDTGTALRWALHTQADGALGGRGKRGSARQQLRAGFGMSQRDLEHLTGIAEECGQEVAAHGDDWSQTAGFAEETVRRFCHEQSGAHVLARCASHREFPVSPAYLRALLDRVDDDRQTDMEKGDSLEDLAFYLLLLLPGCLPRRNLRDPDGAGEFDLVVRNLSETANLTAELLGRHFLVECKNWAKPVDVTYAGHFLYRVHLAHASFGIILSREGVTGRETARYTRALIDRAFRRDGTVCVIVDRNDLNSLQQGESSFWWLLLEKIERLRFGNPKAAMRTRHGGPEQQTDWCARVPTFAGTEADWGENDE